MTRAEAITQAERLEREAAALSAEAHRKLEEAATLRQQHSSWLEAQLASASAEVACWPERKREAYRRFRNA